MLESTNVTGTKNGADPNVLDVGNCDMDHGNISALLQRHFNADVRRAHGSGDAIAAMQRERFDLVMVNRLMDRDGESGLEIIKSIKSNPEFADTPVLMITNFDEHQSLAKKAGAVQGFGKSQLQATATMALLSEYLTPVSPPNKA